MMRAQNLLDDQWTKAATDRLRFSNGQGARWATTSAWQRPIAPHPQGSNGSVEVISSGCQWAARAVLMGALGAWFLFQGLWLRYQLHPKSDRLMPNVRQGCQFSAHSLCPLVSNGWLTAPLVGGNSVTVNLSCQIRFRPRGGPVRSTRGKGVQAEGTV